MNDLDYVWFSYGMEDDISELVWEVFEAFDAQNYSEEGIKTFKEYIEPNHLVDLVKNHGYKIFCCFHKDLLVGVIAYRNRTHISLLFVKKDYQRQGIAKHLFNLSIEKLFPNKNVKLTVYSSHYAVEAYEKLGFFPTDTFKENKGIVYLPMQQYI